MEATDFECIRQAFVEAGVLHDVLADWEPDDVDNPEDVPDGINAGILVTGLGVFGFADGKFVGVAHYNEYFLWYPHEARVEPNM